MPQPLPSRPGRSWWITYAEPLAGLAALLVVFGTFAVARYIASTAANDFSIFLASARWLRQGADPYQLPPFSGPGYNLNAPAALLVFVPLSFLSDARALQVWTGLSLAAYGLAAYWIARAAAPGRVVSVASLLLISQPAIAALLLGQTAALTMLLVTAAWVADRRDRPLRAGFLLGVAMALKLFLGVFAVYAVWRRSRRLALGMAAGAAFTVAAGFGLVGVSGYRSWLFALRHISWVAHWLNGSLLGLFTRELDVSPPILGMTPLVIHPAIVRPLWWIGAAIVAAVSGRALLVARAGAADRRDWAWALLIVAALLVSPLGWVYYVPLAAGPLVGVVMGASRRTRLLMAAAYACFLLPPLSIAGLGALDTTFFGSIGNWGLLILFSALAAQYAPRPVTTLIDVRARM